MRNGCSRKARIWTGRRPRMEQQRNWIGRSEGAEIDFPLAGMDGADPRLHDAARHDLWRDLHGPRPGTSARARARPPRRSARRSLRTSSRPSRKSELDRGMEDEKTGVDTGGFVVNPATGARIPVWIADYVLMGYGTGAIMAVPGHDERDYQFAKTFHLPIVEVVSGGDVSTAAFTGDGAAVNSSNAEVTLNGLSTPEAKERHHVLAGLERARTGHGPVQAPRLALLAPALLGGADPHRSPRRRDDGGRFRKTSSRFFFPTSRSSSRAGRRSRRSRSRPNG